MIRELTDEVIFSHYRPMQFEAENLKPKPRKKKVIDFAEEKCPKCSSSLIKGKTAVGCSNYKVCDFKVPFELMGKKLTENQLLTLITKGKTSTIKGIKNPSGASFYGKFTMDSTFNIQFSQE